MGLYRSPAIALMPDLTPKPLRSTGNAIINLLGTLGAVYSLVMIKVLVGKGDTPNYQPLFIAVGLLMAASVVVLFLTIKEKKLRRELGIEEQVEVEKTSAEEKLSPEMKKSLIRILLSVSFWFMAYNAVTTAFSRYATTVWNVEGGGYADCLMVATVAAVISYLPIGAISNRIGRKRTIQMGIVLLGSCFLIAGFYSNYHFSMNLFFAVIGFAWAAINVNSLPMVVEICSAGNVGKYTGFYYTFSMAAQVFTPILSGFLLEHVSYRTLFPYSVVFCILAFITFSMVKHGDSKPEQKKRIIENFDVED